MTFSGNVRARNELTFYVVDSMEHPRHYKFIIIKMTVAAFRRAKPDAVIGG